MNILSERHKKLYMKKKKLKNTDLLLPGTKFRENITNEWASQWREELLVYQTACRSGKRFHFGLLLRYG